MNRENAVWCTTTSAMLNVATILFIAGRKYTSYGISLSHHSMMTGILIGCDCVIQYATSKYMGDFASERRPLTTVLLQSKCSTWAISYLLPEVSLYLKLHNNESVDDFRWAGNVGGLLFLIPISILLLAERYGKLFPHIDYIPPLIHPPLISRHHHTTPEHGENETHLKIVR